MKRLEREGLDLVAPRYMAIQDGMKADWVPWDRIDGIFLGGTLDWKLANARTWAALARFKGVKAHYGRCGTARRIAAAKTYGYDSLDSCLPLWSKGNQAVFFGALAQTEMWEAAE